MHIYIYIYTYVRTYVDTYTYVYIYIYILDIHIGWVAKLIRLAIESVQVAEFAHDSTRPHRMVVEHRIAVELVGGLTGNHNLFGIYPV